MAGSWQTTAENLNNIGEFIELTEYMQDEEFTRALEMIVKMMSQPDVPPAKAASLIVWCEATAAKFAMLASYHAHIDKSDRAKKNMYFTARDSMQRLTDALKYALR
jgi:hypothetical protein